jgi:hypothetical protein
VSHEDGHDGGRAQAAAPERVHPRRDALRPRPARGSAKSCRSSTIATIAFSRSSLLRTWPVERHRRGAERVGERAHVEPVGAVLGEQREPGSTMRARVRRPSSDPALFAKRRLTAGMRT